MSDGNKSENSQAEFEDGCETHYEYPDPTIPPEIKLYYLENTPRRCLLFADNSQAFTSHDHAASSQPAVANNPEAFTSDEHASISNEHASSQPAVAVNTSQAPITKLAAKKPKADGRKPKYGAEAMRTNNGVREQWCNGCRGFKPFDMFPTEGGVPGARMLKICHYCRARGRKQAQTTGEGEGEAK